MAYVHTLSKLLLNPKLMSKIIYCILFTSQLVNLIDVQLHTSYIHMYIYIYIIFVTESSDDGSTGFIIGAVVGGIVALIILTIILILSIILWRIHKKQNTSGILFFQCTYTTKCSCSNLHLF